LSNKNSRDVAATDAEWSAGADDGESADKDILDAIHVWQVQECRATSFNYTGVSLLTVVLDSDWLARITNWSAGQKSAEEAD